MSAPFFAFLEKPQNIIKNNPIKLKINPIKKPTIRSNLVPSYSL